jgi:hypothetical protein
MSFEVSYTADSLSSETGTWGNEGTLGSGLDITSLTGTVQSESTNTGGTINSLCFGNIDSSSDVTYVDYDTNSDARADLTMEIWWRPDAYPDTRDWILGHDDGGYDRAIMSYDDRFGGLAMGVGTAYSSTLGYPELGEWIHIVAVYSSDGVATLYQNGGDSAGGSQQTVSITADSGSSYSRVGLNAVEKYSSGSKPHDVIGCFAQVQMVDRAVTADEVSVLYDAFDSAINNAPTTRAPTTATPTATPTMSVNALLEINNEKLDFINDQLVEMNSWLMTAFGDDRATNLLCDTDSYNTIKGQWSYDDSDCSLENTDSASGNIVWFGSADGLTPDDSFDADSFTMTASLEVHSGNNAGILFRTGESSTTNDEGPTYYVGLKIASDEVRFGTMDDGWSNKHTASLPLEYDHIYTLSVEASGNLYSVYVNDVRVLADITRTEFGSGSIGLRTYNAPATYHSLSYSADE